jgi:phosphopantothenoylcysteine decarboxylase/phosphopantothenate--cysteine ligase
VKGDIIKVGFAAESGDMVARATEKLKKKHLDLIVVNDISAKDSGFDTDTNRVTFIGRDSKAEQLPLMLKSEVAQKILDRVVALLTH